jgi:hypothetical protein
MAYGIDHGKLLILRGVMKELVKLTVIGVLLAGYAFSQGKRLTFEVASRENVPPEILERPSIFEALRQQLGLRLNPQKGPVEYYVIDHAEKASN